ncbi:MAG: DUF11 domain-containing protein [Thermoflexales bacterium]|nr:DUF11 domain-containing protein [Thermoflexales bacterium]
MRYKRLWVLACTLLLSGGLLYLLFSLPALADIDRTVHTTVDDFTVGEFYLTGMTRQEDGEVSLLSIGLVADWSRPVITGLPPVYGHAMVENKGYVYVIGGRLSADVLTRSVYVSRINTQTHTFEPFTLISELPTWAYADGVYDHAAVVAGDYLYVIGGMDLLDNPSPVAVFAMIYEDGSLGAWDLIDLPAPRGRAPAVEMNGYIYVLGGQPQTGKSVTDTIWYAHPDPDMGGIDEWKVASARLPYAVFNPMAAVHKLEGHPERLYVIGGYYVQQSPRWEGARNEVYFSQPSPDSGDITGTGWISTTMMQNPVSRGAAAIVNGELLVLGGFRDEALNEAHAALLNIETGHIITQGGYPVKAWYTSRAMTSARYWHTAVIGPDQHIYVLGGTQGLDPLTDDLLNVGALTGDASEHGYADSGQYIGPPIDMGRDIKPLFFEWSAYLPTTDVTMTLDYRTRSMQGEWGAWSAPLWPAATLGAFSTTAPFTQTALQFQYRATLSTSNPLSYTPVLRDFKLEYDIVRPPRFLKTANPPSGWDVLQGQKITYTIAFTNPNNRSAINDVLVIDTLPETLHYLEETLAATPGIVVAYYPISRELWCDVGALPPGDSGQVSFVAEVSPTAPLGELSNLAAFRSFEVDSDAGTTHHVAALRPPQVVKTASPPNGSLVQAGGVISYLLTYSNPNNLVLDTLSISDTLPPSTTLVAGSCRPATCVTQTLGGQQVVLWPGATLPPLAEGQAGFELSVDSLALSGTLIVNRAYAAGCVTDGGVCTPVSASQPVTHTVTEMVQPLLSKWADPPPGTLLAPGAYITYTLLYTNPDLVAVLENVSVSDALPPGLELVADTCLLPTCTVASGVLTWTVGALGPSRSGQLQFTARVGGQVVDGAALQNVASLASSQGSAQSNAVAHRVVVPYDLLVTKSDGVGRAEPGDTLIYTIDYTHLVPSGVVTLTNVVITDELLLNPPSPAWAEFLPLSDGWQAGGAPGQRVYQAGSLGPGQSGSITIAVRVSATLPAEAMVGLGNRVSVGDDGAHGRELNAGNNHSSDWDAVRGPDLALDPASLDLPARVDRGELAWIGFDIVNLGVSEAASWEGAQGPWIAVELYTKAAGFTPAGAPLDPHDHAGGWRCVTGAASCAPQDLLNLELVYGDALGVVLEAGAARTVSIDTVFTQTGVYSLYAQVDVGFSWFHDPAWGRVEESSEDNNIVFLGTVTVEGSSPSGSRIYLPLVLKNAR